MTSASLHITRLWAKQVRNLREVVCELSPGLTIFWGDNGQGKTNLLECIALGTLLKPLRPIKQTSDLILHHETEGALKLQLKNTLETSAVEVHLAPTGKRVKLDGKPIRQMAELSRKVCTVTFVPDDLNIIMASSAYRRRALDQLAFGLFPSYLDHLRRYEKTLLSRNHLLKSAFIDPDELNAFTALLIEEAQHIMQMRHNALALWSPFFEQGLLQVSHGSLSGRVTYSAPPSSSELLWSEFKELRQEELRRRSTLFGPHLHDLAIELNGQPARHTASRGQSRATVLAFKMAQLKIIRLHRGLSPILLLDDVISELDPHNIRSLLDTIEALEAQTVLTTTDLDRVGFQKPSMAYQIRDGFII